MADGVISSTERGTNAPSRGMVMELVGWRNTQGQFETATKRAKARQKKAVKSVLEDAKKIAIEESPVGTMRNVNRRSTKTRLSGKRQEKDSIAANWKTTTEEQSVGTVGYLLNASSHAEFVFKGTKPHIITPKNAKVLYFPTSAGEWVFAKKVNHPGTKPNDVPGRVKKRVDKAHGSELRKVAAEVATYIADIFR